MRKRKTGTFTFDHFMTSEEVGIALLARAKAEMKLTALLTSGAPLEDIKIAAKELCSLPSDPYHIAGNFFLLMAKYAKAENEYEGI